MKTVVLYAMRGFPQVLQNMQKENEITARKNMVNNEIF